MDNQKSPKKRDNNKDASVTSPKEITLDDVADVLSLTIVDDDSNKKIVFLAMLSAYTNQSQLNASLNAPSATGKTYLATEIAMLFPDDDKVVRSGASPTSFFYGTGTFDKARNAKIVSLERKILLFYEQPNPALQEKLRALLSHDEREITHALTNKKGGRNQVDMIILQGFPATIFCSANMRLDEQETTRAILVSPEATEAKIRHSIEQRIRRWSNEARFREWLEAKPERITLKNRIVAIRDEHVTDIIINDADAETIKERFFAMVKALKPSHQRDIAHIMQLIHAITLLNVWHRRKPDGSIVANQSDIDQAFELWGDFFESQDIGVSPAVLSIYKKYIVPAYIEKFKLANSDEQIAMAANDIGLTSQELSAYHIKVEGIALNNDQLRKQILPQLQVTGLIAIEKPRIKDNSVDKRTRHIFPKLLTDEDKKNIGIGGMGDDNSDNLPEDYDQLLSLL